MNQDPETAADFFEVLTAQNAVARDRFLSHFEAEIRGVAAAAAQMLPTLEAVPEGFPTDARTLWVQRFLMGAFDCLLSSTQLLVFGHPMPSGNLMRGWIEASSMAMLVATPETGVHEKLQGSGGDYPVQKAHTLLREKAARRAMGTDSEALRQLSKVASWYSHHSHSGVRAILSRELGDRRERFQIAGEFDESKLDYYANELKNRLGASEALGLTIGFCKRQLVRVSGEKSVT